MLTRQPAPVVECSDHIRILDDFSVAPSLPVTGPGIAISVSLPALGPGNAKAAVSANGYQISVSPFRE